MLFPTPPVHAANIRQALPFIQQSLDSTKPQHVSIFKCNIFSH